MDRLKSLQVFVEVVHLSSYTKAAEKLRLSRASVSKTVSALEDLYGTRLLMRSTHHVRPTEAGLAVFKWANSLVDDYNTMEKELKAQADVVAGEIHVGTPPSFGSFHFIPAITAFQDQFPDIRLFLHSDYGRADLVQAGLDFSVRISTQLPDSSLYSQ
jgi:DNA-binding transcriptional LysR family regulator